MGNCQNTSYPGLSPNCARGNDCLVLPLDSNPLVRNISAEWHRIHIISNCTSQDVSNVLDHELSVGGSEKLLSVYIALIAMSALPLQLADLDEVQDLTITESNLTSLDRILGTMESLETLRFQKNQIENIQDGFFHGFPKLKNVDLSTNKLKTVSTEIFFLLFQVPWYKMSINLRNNSIAKTTFSTQNIECHPKQPYEIHKQSELILASNRLTFIDDMFRGWGFNRSQSECWVKTGLFDHVTVDDNPWQCDCRDCYLHQAALHACTQVFFRYAKCSYNGGVERYMSMFSQQDLDRLYCPVADDSCPSHCRCRYHSCQQTTHVQCHNQTLANLKLVDFSGDHKFVNISIDKGSIPAIHNHPFLNTTRSLSITDSAVISISQNALMSLRVSAEAVDLRGNQLTSLPDTGNWSRLVPGSLVLHGNIWHCDCDVEWMKYWISKYASPEEQQLIKCASPAYNKGHVLVSLPDHRFLCLSTVVLYSTILSITVLGGVTGILIYRLRFWLYIRYGIHPFERDECANENKRYDVFVSYSNHDDTFARDLMLSLQTRGYRICCHELDFFPGTSIAANVDQAVHQSKRTLCLVSANFVDSPVCLSEFDTARSFDIAYHKNRLIMIKFKDVAHGELPSQLEQYVKSYTYLKADSPFFMKRLMYMLAQNKMGPPDADDQQVLVQL